MISRPETRAGSALAAVAGQGRRTTIKLPSAACAEAICSVETETKAGSAQDLAELPLYMVSQILLQQLPSVPQQSYLGEKSATGSA